MAIISYEYFQRRFGSNPAALGQSLNKGKPFSPRIVGVLAPHFQIYFPPSADQEAAPEIWLANRLGYDAAQRNGVSMHVIGRLQPGITIGRAQAAADQVAADARKNFTIEKYRGLRNPRRADAAASGRGSAPRNSSVDGSRDFSSAHCLR